MTAYSVIFGGILAKFELNPSFYVCTSLPAIMKKIQLKMKALECSHDFSHYKSMEIFPDARAATSAVHVRIWAKFELVRDFMVVLVTCKTEEDPIENVGARVFTILYIFFSDTQALGQITLELVVVSGQNLNSSKLHACPRYLQECR